MAKLDPDYINWVLTLNASQVQEEYHKLEKENKELQKQTNASRKAMAQLEAEGKKGSAEWNNLRQSISQNSRVMSENRAKMDELAKRFDLTTMSVNQLKKRLGDLKKEFNSTSRATDPKRYKELRNEINKVKGAIDKADASARGLRGGFYSLTKMKQSLIGFFNGVGLTIFALVTGAFREAFNLVVDFERANSRLASVLGTTREGIKELEAAARQLGATTSYSAAQVTSLQIELAKLGFGKEQILQMEGAVLKFAKAVDTDLASSAAFAGAALRIFNKDASETEDVLATFAVATTKTALDFSKLEASMSTVGPVANSFGLSIEDTTALLGMLANAGFDASSAATATRNIILNLCDANGDLAKALGAPVHNVGDLAEGLKKLNAEGIDLAKALELTDKRSVAAFSTFLDQADNITALRDAITGVTGDFNRMSETMGDNVAGAMAGLKSAAEELVLKISQGTNGPIKDLIKWLTSIVQKTGEVITKLEKFSNIIKATAVVLISYKAAVKTTNLVVIAYRKSLQLLAGCKALSVAVWNGLCGAFRNLRNGISAATLSFNGLKTAMSSVPWMAVINVVLTVVTSLLALKKQTEETLTATKALNNASKESTQEYAKQKSNIESLLLVAKNENISLERRQRAVLELNKIIPNYNAQIDKTTGKYKAANEQLTAYLDSLEKEMRYKANKDALEKLIENAEEKRRQRDDVEIEQVKVIKQKRVEQTKIGKDNSKNTSYGAQLGASTRNYGEYQRLEREIVEAGKKRRIARIAVEDADAEVEKMKSRINAGINSGKLIAPETSENIDTELTEPLKRAGEVADSTIEKLKSLQDELKALRKEEPKTKEDLKRIEERKAEIQKEINELKGKSSNRNKRAPGTYKPDSIDEATAAADDLHQKKLLDITEMKGSISEADLVIKKNEELIRYCGDLQIALDELRSKTDSTHKETLDKIKKRQNQIALDIQTATQNINSATIQKEEKQHKDRLNILEIAYEEEEKVIRENVNKQQITQEQADIYLLKKQESLHNKQLEELQSYYKKVDASTTMGQEERKNKLETIASEIRKMQSQILTDTGRFQEILRSYMTNTTSLSGIRRQFEVQKKGIEAVYSELLKGVSEGSDEAVALEEEKQRRIAALNYEYQEQVWQLQELTGLSWADEYNRELAQLENYHRQGMISEEAYQRKRLELGVNNAKRYFDYYAQLSGSMFTAIQDAEIAKSDAKFDVLIQQAKNNGEETAGLEEEKENRKLEIQKKYADVNFAIKISQIVADTAVSIMRAFSDLGPIGGAVAAALLTATGVAQVIQAKAERDKVKNMQPGNTTGSSTGTQTAKAERVLSGYSEGGYTGDGDRYEVAGVVHRGEYVVPKPIMGDRRVIDAVGTIEAIRLNRGVGGGARGVGSAVGFSDGGFTSGSVPSGAVSELLEAVREFRSAAGNLRAYVVLRDIENASERQDRARAPFTRNRGDKK